MAKTPKQVSKKIAQIQNRMKSQVNKRVLVKKPDSKPVYKLPSKAAQTRQRKDYLTLKDLMRETTSRTRQLMRQGGVEVTYLKKTKSGRTVLCETVTNKPSGPAKYKQLIQNMDAYTEKFSDSIWIMAECTCADYKFRRDWALHQKNASTLKYAIDEPPDFTNPAPRNLGVCKHLYRALQRVVGKNW